MKIAHLDKVCVYRGGGIYFENKMAGWIVMLLADRDDLLESWCEIRLWLCVEVSWMVLVRAGSIN